MTHINVELPEKILTLMRCSSVELSEEMRWASAVYWYQQGRISQEWAANIAGMDRTDFLLALARMEKESFLVDFDDLDRELSRG